MIYGLGGGGGGVGGSYVIKEKTNMGPFGTFAMRLVIAFGNFFRKHLLIEAW